MSLAEGPLPNPADACYRETGVPLAEARQSSSTTILRFTGRVPMIGFEMGIPRINREPNDATRFAGNNLYPIFLFVIGGFFCRTVWDEGS